MNYKELFSAINCQRLVIIEDDFQQTPYSKNRVIYDIARMNLDDRKYFMEEINSDSPELNKSLCAFLSCFDKHLDKIENWDEVILAGDILSSPFITNNASLNSEFTKLFNRIEDDLLEKYAYPIGSKYGISMPPPAYFETLYNEYIAQENRLQSIRIYTDFSSSTQKLFEKDLDHANTEESIVCIIDDFLTNESRAEEIIDEIEKRCKQDRKNIIGSIFSSRTPPDKISEAVYFEYTAKANGNLESAIAKSAYHFFITELKNDTIDGINQAFNDALKNKSIAFYLSKKAYLEGSSEYQIINDWINLLSTSSRKNTETVKRLTCLSRVINSLEDSGDLPNTELQKLNTLEAFDYSINDFYLPIASGDIFTTNDDKWFVLIGQDCDMARRPKKGPRIAVAEFLKITLRNQSEFGKWYNDSSQVLIYNFRKSLSEISEMIQVDYKQRCFVPNEVVNLCSFNEDGQCRISLSQELNIEQTKLMPDYMINYYKQLQSYFSTVKSLQDKAKKDFQSIINYSCDNFLVLPTDYQEGNNLISFNLKRVCRLSHNYVFYLYKLYLEYRGRQPFQTINLMQQQELSLPVTINDNNAHNITLPLICILNPQKNSLKDCWWKVTKTSLNCINQFLGEEDIDYSSEEIIIDEPSKTIPLVNAKKQLIFEKKKDKVNLRFVEI